LWRRHAEIESRGTQIVIVGNGSADFIRGFKEDLKIGFPVYTDPSRKSYEAAGLKRSVWRSITLPVAIKTLKSRLFRINEKMASGVQGDPWQLGGMLIVNPQDKVLYHFVSKTNGARANIDDILKSLD
jgi:hypothetical protein